MTKKPTLLKGLRINELTICAQPANQHSFATIFKSDEPLVEAITKACIDVDDGSVSFIDALNEENERTKNWKAREKLWPIMDAFRLSVNSTITDSTLSGEERIGRIQQSAFELVGAIREKFPDVEAELNKLFDETVNKEIPMTEAEKAQLAELQKNFDAMKAENTILGAIAKMSDEEKRYYDSLKDDKDKDEFRALDSEKRKKLLEANKSADEVFKNVDGVEIRKSEVGDATFAILKSQDERIAKQAEDLAKANDRALMVTLEKKANDELGHLPGTLTEKAVVLKSISNLPEAERKTLDTMLKAGEAAIKSAFSMNGTKSDIEGTPESDLNKAITEYATTHKVSVEKATEMVLSQNPDLYDLSQAN